MEAQNVQSSLLNAAIVGILAFWKRDGKILSDDLEHELVTERSSLLVLFIVKDLFKWSIRKEALIIQIDDQEVITGQNDEYVAEYFKAEQHFFEIGCVLIDLTHKMFWAGKVQNELAILWPQSDPISIDIFGILQNVDLSAIWAVHEIHIPTYLFG